MTIRALSTLLVVAGTLAGLGVLLAGVLAWRLVELRTETAAALQECTCCQDSSRMDR